MVNALHRDGGVGNRISLQVTDEALHATVNLQNHTSTSTERPDHSLFPGGRKQMKQTEELSSPEQQQQHRQQALPCVPVKGPAVSILTMTALCKVEAALCCLKAAQSGWTAVTQTQTVIHVSLQ